MYVKVRNKAFQSIVCWSKQFFYSTHKHQKFDKWIKNKILFRHREQLFGVYLQITILTSRRRELYELNWIGSHYRIVGLFFLPYARFISIPLLICRSVENLYVDHFKYCKLPTIITVIFLCSGISKEIKGLN